MSAPGAGPREAAGDQCARGLDFGSPFPPREAGVRGRTERDGDSSPLSAEFPSFSKAAHFQKRGQQKKGTCGRHSTPAQPARRSLHPPPAARRPREAPPRRCPNPGSAPASGRGPGYTGRRSRAPRGLGRGPGGRSALLLRARPGRASAGVGPAFPQLPSQRLGRPAVRPAASPASGSGPGNAGRDSGRGLGGGSRARAQAQELVPVRSPGRSRPAEPGRAGRSLGSGPRARPCCGEARGAGGWGCARGGRWAERTRTQVFVILVAPVSLAPAHSSRALPTQAFRVSGEVCEPGHRGTHRLSRAPPRKGPMVHLLLGCGAFLSLAPKLSVWAAGPEQRPC